MNFTSLFLGKMNFNNLKKLNAYSVDSSAYTELSETFKRIFN
ncbi:hypothetical protein F991_01874 [Acinetobacter sp. CIP-A165]|nr:hypothetical protein F991_01874 [Acinetobacter sp. CIP-A165]MDR7015309.1 hypothetical protein [Prolinoborus sp. 3657]